MTTVTRHGEVLERAFSYLHTPTSQRQLSDYEGFFDLLAEGLVVAYSSPEGAGEIVGKQAMVDHAIGFLKEGGDETTEDVQLDGPMEFYGEQDRIVAIGKEFYTDRITRSVTHRKTFVLIVDFDDGLIERIEKFSN